MKNMTGSNPIYNSDENTDDDEKNLILKVNVASSTPYEQKITCYVYCLAFFAAIGGLLFGYDTGVISGAMIPIKRKFNLSEELQELVVSITVGGAIFGAVTSGFLNERFGRRIVLLIASLVFTGGAILMSSSFSVAQLLIGRLVVGIGIGYASSTVPVYIAEAAPAQIRGQLVTVNQLFITFGQFLASVLNGAFSYIENDGWRYMLGIAVVPSLILFIGFLFMPESPRWLIGKERIDDARKVLQKLRGEINVEAELNHIQEAVNESTKQDSSSSWSRIIRTRSTRRALIVGCGLQAFQQLAGINTVMYYSGTIIEMTGIENQTTIIWLTAAVASGNFIFTLISMGVIDRIGRRKLTLGSIFGVVMALLLLAGTFILLKKTSPKVTYTAPHNYTEHCATYSTCYTCVQDSSCGFCFIKNSGNILNGSCLASVKDDRSLFCNASAYIPKADLTWSNNACPTSYAWLAVVSMVFYLAMFAPGLGPMPWTINAEIYPLWARNVGISASTATNWTFNLLVSLTFLDLLNLLTRPGAFSLYAAISLVGFVFLYVFLPETKGKKLEDVEKLFEGRATLYSM